MKAIEIRSNSVQVSTNNGIMLVAKYEDKNGVYFYNEKLEKQYATIEPKVKAKKVSNLKEYKFIVEYNRKNSQKGFMQKETKVMATSYESAISKVKNNFAIIYEISEI